MKLSKNFFSRFFSRYQIELETLMRSSKFIFDYIDSLYYKRYKINVKRDESYISSPTGSKFTKQHNIVNTVNRDDDKCFQHATTLPLNHEEIGQNSCWTSLDWINLKRKIIRQLLLK